VGPIVRRRVAVLLLLFGTMLGCSPRDLDWSFRFESDALRARARVVEVSVLEGGCEGERVVYAADHAPGLAPPPAPRLGPGRYGLRGRARDAECAWFASGCEEVTLPGKDDALIEIVMGSLPLEEPACTTGVCAEGRCEQSGPCVWEGGAFSFEPPVALTVLSSSAMESDPYLRSDGLRIFFASLRPETLGSWDLYWADRATTSAPWSAPIHNTDVSSTADDTRFAPTPERLTAYLASSRPGGVGGSDLWVLDRPSSDVPFDSYLPMSALDTTMQEYDPSPSADGLRLYFVVSDRLGPGGLDIVYSERGSPTEPFTVIAPLEGVTSVADDSSPTLTVDERVVVFASSREGDSDIWYATRPDRVSAFSAPVLVPGVNTESEEAEPFITADGCWLYFTSARPGGLGEADLYSARYVAQP